MKHYSTIFLCMTLALAVTVACSDSSDSGGGTTGEPLRTKCEQATDKVKECFPEASGQATKDCSGTAECQADCYLEATCDEIKNGAESLANCVAAC